MRALVQRVSEASVVIDGETVGSIGEGLVVLVGVGRGDSAENADTLARKVAELRIFDDPEGRMNRSLADLAGPAALCVSQVTLYADTRKGRRPSFDGAAAPDIGKALCERFYAELAERGVRVETGRFGARMLVSLANEGPVTLLVET